MLVSFMHALITSRSSFRMQVSRRGQMWAYAPMFMGSSWAHMNSALGYRLNSRCTKSKGKGTSCSKKTTLVHQVLMRQ